MKGYMFYMDSKMTVKATVKAAFDNGIIIPAFNIPYLPMLKPVTQAIVGENSIAMVQVARLEWEKFEAKSPEAVAEEYFRYCKGGYTMLHLDHVPVIDEDDIRVDYLPILERAIKIGYQSIMVDGSRLPLDENIAVTKAAAMLAHASGIALEAELGAVMGHERGGISRSYDEIFEGKIGFTIPEEAARFVAGIGCDWLSVAAGSVHGAIAENLRKQKKPEARLDIEHIKALRKAAGIPLVLHGGSGIRQEYILEAIKAGVAKINVGTEIRQPYEQAMEERGDTSYSQSVVYERTCRTHMQRQAHRTYRTHKACRSRRDVWHGEYRQGISRATFL